MYGLVNKAVKGFVLKNFDEATWSRIHTAAGVDSDFTAMQAYEDDVTYNLVGLLLSSRRVDSLCRGPLSRSW